MSDTENNNNHDKIDERDANRSSPGTTALRFGGGVHHRKRPSSADIDGDIMDHEDVEEPMHFKRRHPSAEVLTDRNSFDYLPHGLSGNTVASMHAAASAHAESQAVAESESQQHRIRSRNRSMSPASTIKEELSLKDISMLRGNPEDPGNALHDSRSNVKREKY